MSFGPSLAMREAIVRRMPSRIRLTTLTRGDDPDPTTGETIDTVQDRADWPALLREATADRAETEGRTIGVRDLTVLTTAPLEAGQTFTVLTSPDATLTGRVVEVSTVVRDDLTVTRRATCRVRSGS